MWIRIGEQYNDNWTTIYPDFFPLVFILGKLFMRESENGTSNN